MKYEWNRIDIKNKWILFTSKLQDNDSRIENFRRKWYDSEFDDIYDDIEKENAYDYGFSINYKKKEIQYWINIEKKNYNEFKEIFLFYSNCSRFSLGKFDLRTYINTIINTIILQIDFNVNFDLFGFSEDEYFNVKYKNYLLTYNKNKCYIKTNCINNFEVLDDKYSTDKYINLKYNNNTNLLFEFIKNLDNKIKGIICNDNYMSIIKENNIMNIKIKNTKIKSMTYNDSYLYIKCNRLWNINNKWGVSLVIDKIMDN